MRHILLILATLAVVCVAANQVQAHEYHHGHGYYAYRAPIVVAPRVVAVVPGPVYPPAVYPPAVYPYAGAVPYAPAPACGVFYNGPRLSIGVGF
jgi:hypothetical protein